MTTKLFRQDIKVINVGLASFYEDLKYQRAKVTKVDWRPPAGGNLKLIQLLSKAESEEVANANKIAVKKIVTSSPKLIDIKRARDVIGVLRGNMTLLHSGPPIEWERMSGPTKGGVIGAAIFEGWASDARQAEELAKSGQIRFETCHDNSAVGPMAGIISPSMSVYVVKNEENGNIAFSNLNEGVGRVLRYGAYDEEVQTRLKFMEDVLSPLLKAALIITGPLDLKNIMAQSLQMGDELHTRNVASSLLLLKELGPSMVNTDFSKSDISASIDFIVKNQLFFLNIAMAAGKSIMDAANGIRASSVITALTRNGTDFGVRVSALKDKWFTAPAPIPKTLFFPGYKEEDANPDIGDSAIMETNGFGAFASAASPAVVQVVGGDVKEALRNTIKMSEICLIKDKSFPIPQNNFEGIPRAIDLRRIIETGTAPIINTGVANKKPGMGTVGFGILDAPMGAFIRAFEEYASTL